MFSVPAVGDLLRCLADVLAILDIPGEGAWSVERRKDALVHAYADADLAFQVDAGRKMAIPV